MTNKLTYEKPAEGIMKTREFKDSMFFKVECQCGNPDDELNFEIEVDKDVNDIIVNTWIVQKSNWWDQTFPKRYDIDNPALQWFDWFWKDAINGIIRKARLTWTLWTKGYVKYESTTVMSKQQAFNYAETLKAAIAELEARNKR